MFCMKIFCLFQTIERTALNQIAVAVGKMIQIDIGDITLATL